MLESAMAAADRGEKIHGDDSADGFDFTAGLFTTPFILLLALVCRKQNFRTHIFKPKKAREASRVGKSGGKNNDQELRVAGIWRNIRLDCGKNYILHRAASPVQVFAMEPINEIKSELTKSSCQQKNHLVSQCYMLQYHYVYI
jgi:hypothetical protein